MCTRRSSCWPTTSPRCSWRPSRTCRGGATTTWRTTRRRPTSTWPPSSRRCSSCVAAGAGCSSPRSTSSSFPVLDKVFPGVAVVCTHRDPVPVAISMVAMLTYSARMHRSPVPVEEIATGWIDRLELMLAALVRDRDVIAPERSIDVTFDEFMADELGIAERVFGLVGEPMTDDARTAMAEYLAGHQRGRLGKVADVVRDVRARRRRPARAVRAVRQRASCRSGARLRDLPRLHHKNRQPGRWPRGSRRRSRKSHRPFAIPSAGPPRPRRPRATRSPRRRRRSRWS